MGRFLSYTVLYFRIPITSAVKSAAVRAVGSEALA